VDVVVDRKSACQTTLKTRAIGSTTEEVVWNQDFSMPLLHLRTPVVLSLFSGKKNVLVGCSTVHVAALSRGSSTGPAADSATVCPLQSAAEGSVNIQEGELVV
jgi:hypothetical protein